MISLGSLYSSSELDKALGIALMSRMNETWALVRTSKAELILLRRLSFYIQVQVPDSFDALDKDALALCQA